MPTNSPISTIITDKIIEVLDPPRVVSAAGQPALVPAVHRRRRDQQMVQRRRGGEKATAGPIRSKNTTCGIVGPVTATGSFRRYDAVTGSARLLLARSMNAASAASSTPAKTLSARSRR